MKTNMVEIDGEKLKKIFLNRNLSISDVSMKMGFNPGYISNVCSRNRITRNGIISLKNICDIDPEEYAIEENNSNQMEKQPPTKNDYDLELEEIIYRAIKRALSE